MKVACVGGGIFCGLASLFMSGSVGFRVLWALYQMQLVATLALYLFRRRHPIPRHWEDVIAADLERYVPVNIDGFRMLQWHMADAGQITKIVLVKWLEAESLATGLISPPEEWPFTAREFPGHLEEERDERGEKP
ncbi:hypothetical protein CWS43_26195 [Rahnella sp. AA]|nr:hypothetical protein CWS43_26195 [Rahnella sp. AA]